jgi:pyruvyltransferase
VGEEERACRIDRDGERVQMKMYWFRGMSWDGSLGNFGDWLTPYFLAKLTKIKIEWVRPAEAELFGCGSIVEAIPEGFTGTILTSGIMHETTQRPDLASANLLGLRGPLTAERIGDLNGVQYGDLGLLCRLFAPRVHKQYEVGVIPHYVFSDREYPGHHVIKVTSGIEHVVREASKCERILTSSLHGVILADALGIENKWEYTDRVFGKGFKFRDYASALGEEITPGEWRLGNQERVAEIATSLESIVKRLK